MLTTKSKALFRQTEATPSHLEKVTMKIAKIESIPLRIPFTTGGPSSAGA